MEKQKAKVPPVTVVLVKCKQVPSSDYQNWIDHLSFIWSVCSACQTLTGFGNTSPSTHYDRFVASGKRNKGESFDQCMDRLEAAIKADPEKHRAEW